MESYHPLQQQQQQDSGHAAATPQHSENVEEELRRVQLALDVIFSSPSQDVGQRHQQPNQQSGGEWSVQNRAMADQYLTSFQTQTISWMVCDQLLSQPFPESATGTPGGMNNGFLQQQQQHQQRCFFAAQTLHTKCCTDIHEIPTDSLVSLRNSLLTHLRRYSSSSASLSSKNSSDSDALTNRLAMCVSVVAVQMGWTSIITELLSSIAQSQDSADSFTNNTHNNHNVTMAILRALPEECASDRLFLIDENTRYQMRDHLISVASNVFAYLYSFIGEHTLASLSSQSKHTTTSFELVFKVFYIWIRFVPVHPTSLKDTPLLTRSIQALTQPEYLEVAADVVVEVLRMYPSRNYNNDGLVQMMIPSLAQLPLEDVLQSGNEDAMRVYCRIVTEMGESYMNLILSTDYPQSSKLVQGVLRCTEIPDTEISSITFHFWYTMVMDLDDCEPYEWRQELVDFYTPFLLKLIHVCTSNLMKYPTDIEGFTDDRMDDLNNHRMYVSDTVEDCCRLLGGNLILQEVGRFVKEEVNRISARQHSEWHGLESGLACLISLHKYVPSDESDVVPFCCQLIPQLPTDPPLLRYTANRFIGKYIFWLAAHPNILQPLLPYLSAGLKIPGCASAAAIAIKELCQCSNQNLAMAQPVLQLYEEYTSPVSRLDLPDELQLLEGVCRALSRTISQGTRDESRAYLSRLAQPIGNRFATAVADSKSTPATLVPELDRLTIIVQHFVIPSVSGAVTTHPVIELLQSLWNLLNTAMTRFPHDLSLSEKLCRFHKHTLRSCGPVIYLPMLEPLMQQLIRSFELTRQSPYLYAASICVASYGEQKCQDVSQHMYEMVAAMANVAFSFLRNFEEFTNHPDVIEELFYLMARMMDCYPEPIVTSPLLLSLCQCAIVAMQIDHHGAHKGTLKFVDCTLTYCMKIKTEQNESKPEIHAALSNLFSNGGQPLVSNLIRILVADLPSYSNQTPDLLWKLNITFPGLFCQWIQMLFNDTTVSFPVPDQAKKEFIAAIDLRLEKDDFFLVLDAFRSSCERERRMRKIALLRNRQTS